MLISNICFIWYTRQGKRKSARITLEARGICEPVLSGLQVQLLQMYQYKNPI